MNEKTQTVVDETKPLAQPNGAADTSAREDVDPLDKLLAEFDQATKPAPTTTQPETKPTQPEAPAVDSSRIARLEQRLFEEDLNQAVTNIFGDMKVSRRVAKGWLDQMARENPALGQAFLNKANDPKTWARIERSLSKEAAKDFKASDIDETVTADVAAVAAAVRGASTKVAPEPQPNLGQMSDAELRQWRMKTYGF